MNGGRAEIILVDDASTDRRTQELCSNAAKSHGWKYIRNKEALGHSAATQVGIDLSTRPLLCLLNSDTVVPPGTWESIVDVFDWDPSIAVVGPSTCHGHSKQCLRGITERRFEWTNEQIYHYAASRNQRFWSIARMVAPNSWVTPQIRHVGGFAFFVRRETWEKEGGFDNRFKDYFNETDFCYRIAKRGYRIHWTRLVYIHHLAEQSYGALVSPKKTQAEKLFLTIHGEP